MNQVMLQAPGVVQDSYGQLHVRGDHANLQYRINGVMIPESISGFGQTLDTQLIQSVKLLDGALPAQYGERTAAVVDITTKSGSDLGNGGSVGITGGSFGTVNPNASLWGNSGNWSYFFTANYLKTTSASRIRRPAKADSRSHQPGEGFGDVTYLINDDTRLSFLFGVSNNRFEIPNNPGQTPQFGYLDTVNFNSANLNEQQTNRPASACWRCRASWAIPPIRSRGCALQQSAILSGRHRRSDVQRRRRTDQRQGDHAKTLQADFAMPWGDNHTLRYGLYGEFDQAYTNTNSLVFPANPDGNRPAPRRSTSSRQQHHRQTWAAYVQDEWNIGDNWTVNYGLRGDEYEAFRTESQLSPRLGMVWQATDSTTVHAGYSRYFTPPQTS
jgi:outer membrane receptor protein involved in Fe transport